MPRNLLVRSACAPDRYEFLVYLLLRRRLESGDIFCRESVRFRSFEDDLRADQRWQEKDQTSPKSPLRIWGAKSTVPVVHQFDEQPCGVTAA
jgi:hypothetical protein